MDLINGDEGVCNKYDGTEYIFLGPDENTAGYMDMACECVLCASFAALVVAQTDDRQTDSIGMAGRGGGREGKIFGWPPRSLAERLR
jgi:hypothetical protein